MDEDELYAIASGRAERDAGFLYADGTLNRLDRIHRAESAKEEAELWGRNGRGGLEVQQEAARRGRHRFFAEPDMPNFCLRCGVNKANHGWPE